MSFVNEQFVYAELFKIYCVIMILLKFVKLLFKGFLCSLHSFYLKSAAIIFSHFLNTGNNIINLTLDSIYLTFL